MNAVYGFCNMLMKVIRDLDADYFAVIFDAGRHTFRTDIYPDYKANRGDPPEDLIPQFGLIREATEAFGAPSIELAGYEADDLIAAYAKAATARGWRVSILSTDKDLMQLVTDDVEMFDPLKNRALRADAVQEKFGVPPSQVVDVQALAGDSVDNVPGVPGIGLKTAAQLINTYGSLETLLERAGEIKQPKRRQNLLEHAALARISKRLVALDADAPLPVPLEQLGVRAPDQAVLVPFLQTQSFRSILRKLGNETVEESAGDTTADTADPNSGPDGIGTLAYQPKITHPIERDGYQLIQETGALADFLVAVRAAGVVAVDTETSSLTPATAELIGVSLAVPAQGTDPKRVCYIPLGHGPKGDDLLETTPKPAQIPVLAAAALLREVLEDPAILKIGHNFKFDWQVLCQTRHGGINTGPVDDTMLMHYCLSGRGRGNGLDDVTLDLLGHVNITFEEVCGSGRNRIPFSAVPLEQALAYAAEDADATLGIWRHLKPQLPRSRMVTLYETIERPLVHVVSKMESTGILVDRGVLAALSQDYATRIAALETAVHEAAGRSFNLGSPKQLGEVLFDELSLPGGKRTKNGAYSTDSSVLEPLAAQGHDIVRKLLEWRHLAKLKSTYADALQEQIAEDGRVRSSFGITATTTGRFSSTDPNLQNIPVRDEEGRNIRRAFIAPPGHRLMSVDYSQIELRLAAAMADVPALKEAFQQGVDIHALTASQVFGVPMEDMPGEIRRRAKAINFGIIYGISGFGLANNLGIPQSEASAFIKAYFDRFPEIRAYMDATKAYAREHGHVRTLFGRRCVIDGINDKAPARRAGAERQAINAPIQGTAADILKRAMAQMPGALAEAKLSARLLLTVHDELVFEVPEAELDQTRTVVRNTMEAAAVLPVPLVAEAGDGLSWAEAH